MRFSYHQEKASESEISWLYLEAEVNCLKSLLKRLIKPYSFLYIFGLPSSSLDSNTPSSVVNVKPNVFYSETLCKSSKRGRSENICCCRWWQLQNPRWDLLSWGQEGLSRSIGDEPYTPPNNFCWWKLHLDKLNTNTKTFHTREIISSAVDSPVTNDTWFPKWIVCWREVGFGEYCGNTCF